MNGYVYILANSAIPNLIKIGRTTKDPKERASELSGTGIPGKFIVIYSVYVTDCVLLEKEMHDHFSEQRHSNDREFFEIEPKLAIDYLIESSSREILEDNEAIESNSNYDQDSESDNNSEFNEDEYFKVTQHNPQNISNFFSFTIYLAKINSYTFRFGISIGNLIKINNDELCDRLYSYYKDLGVSESIKPSIIKSRYYKIHGECNEQINSIIKSNIQKLIQNNLSKNNKRYYEFIYDSNTVWNFNNIKPNIIFFEKQFDSISKEIYDLQLKRTDEFIFYTKEIEKLNSIKDLKEKEIKAKEKQIQEAIQKNELIKKYNV